ncbi:hypothetical protein SLS53_007144 [Cytospora paraplurivora]|uniref:aspartyl aminopeptidase n=1 Tax=Cytospora paraplurivora TaxID=2898453 RepID=A0AAN9YDF9_9PEZI
MAPPKSALEFLDFVNASPTPYHAVASAVTRLEAAGFKAIKERDNWSSELQPGGKYYLTRNGSSIVAFAIGKKWAPGNPIAMIGAHTDSPTLRIKPVSKQTNAGFLQVGVETYGGGIWHTWFDRDLSVAGRVLVKDPEGNFVQKLIKVDKPILRIPTLAIHLDRASNFDPNKETELFPIAGLAAAELNRTGVTEKEAKEKAAEFDENGEFQPLKALTQRHHPYLIDIIAQHAGVEADGVVDFELVLYDTQKSSLGGINDEFIFSPRLDNLNMTYCSILGLIESVKSDISLDDDASIRLITCFDHEEIGSTSAHGANSNLLPAVIRRLSVLPRANFVENGSEKSYDHVNADDIATAFEQTLSTSFFVSADMAEVAKKAGVPLQLFVVRNDSSCGSTIGPMLSAKLGVRTLDLGNPQLSMHSIRETGGSYDVEHGIKLFESFLSNYAALESKILVD